jgi:hypothetical protein
LIFGIFCVHLVWLLLCERTWDDDCLVRFLKLRDAPLDAMFDRWVRPLFALLYFLPARIGLFAVNFQALLLSLLTAWLVFKTAKEMKLAVPQLSIVFLIFQPFWWGTSAQAVTEPLAGLIIAASLYFHTTKRWELFALMGGFLPLARLELIVLLPLWVIVLWRKKEFIRFPFLTLPGLLWLVAGSLHFGAPTWLFSSTHAYGTGPFSWYFERYIYIAGAPVLYFVWLALLKSRRAEFRHGLFFSAFFLYILIFWKADIGSVGFLRHLVVISPVAALLANEGFSKWLDKKDRLSLFASSALITITTFMILSRELIGHHNLGEINLANGITISFCAIAMLVNSANNYKVPKAFFIAGVFMVSTLSAEKPLELSPEQQEVKRAAKFCWKNDINPTYVNHPWFGWFLDRSQTKFKKVTVENLDSAPVGSVVIWENHYSHRLAGNVMPEYFRDSRFVLIKSFEPVLNRFIIAVLRKE